jgi:exopolysaccharide production protein ExoQ
VSTMNVSIGSGEATRYRNAIGFPVVVGFFFVFRVGLTFLLFQADPAVGTIVGLAGDCALLFGAAIYTFGESADSVAVWQIPAMKWLGGLLLFSLVSVLWTGAQSAATALAYWVGMAANLATVVMIVRRGSAERCTSELMKGAVYGAVALSVVAWIAPVTADLRLGDDVFLHPNTLGLEIAMATLFAQYLVREGAGWKWIGAGLAITMLRTLSKTTIVAFVVAEGWYLLQDKRMARAAKVKLALAGLVVVASFWGLLNSYVEIYSNSGSGRQLETLTGRTLLWTVALAMGAEKPWFGHGFYSFRTLIPAFGNFAPWHAHNELLQQFFEFGAAGVVIVVGVYWTFYRLVRRAAESELRALAIALMIFALVHGLTDAVPFGLTYPLWLLAALTLCFTAAEGGTA